MKVDNKIVLSDIGVTYRTIEFSDKAINKLKIISTKKNIDVRFKNLPSYLRGLHLKYSPITQLKKFYLRYKYKGKAIPLPLGEFIPGHCEVIQVSKEVLSLHEKYYVSGKWKCDLEYRFDGKKFLFKRPGAIKVLGPPKLPLKTSHEKVLRDYDRRVQKRYNRGSTHRDHGGEPSRKGNYTQQSFKHHNELKLLNSLQGKYQNDAQRREFEAMNEEALKEADKRAKEKAEKPFGKYHDRPKYGGMVRGYSGPQWDRPYDLDRPRRPDSSFHITGKPYYEMGTKEEEKEENYLHLGQTSGKRSRG